MKQDNSKQMEFGSIYILYYAESEGRGEVEVYYATEIVPTLHDPYSAAVQNHKIDDRLAPAATLSNWRMCRDF